MPRLALVTSLAVAREHVDDDMPPLLAALPEAEAVAWDDPAVDWSRYDLAVLRSTWGYMERLADFLGWIDRTSKAVRLLEFEATVPSLFLNLEPGSAARLAAAIQRRVAAPV